jgi:prepilin-type N-terminal cleavage/methylation domain-containing protein
VTGSGQKSNSSIEKGAKQMRKKGFTLIELLVVIAIIAMLLAILMPALNKVKQMAMKVICGTNVKGLGTALMVYAGDYEDAYPVQSGKGSHQWQNATQGWQNAAKNWENGGDTSPLTVGASLYLLVREADVNPKSFKCPASSEVAYEGLNTQGLDLVQLWDFGHKDPPNNLGPAKCVSYSYHLPYGPPSNYGASAYAATATATASFAVMSDKNPLFDHKLTKGGSTEDNYLDKVGRLGAWWAVGQNVPKWKILHANSEAHNREGQNVLFGDGHNEWAKTPDVGVRHDNIYTIRGGGTETIESPVRSGAYGASYGVDNALADVLATSGLSPSQDSFLVNDDEGL